MIMIRTLSLLAACALFLGFFVWDGPTAALAGAGRNPGNATSNASSQDKAARPKASSTGTQLATSELLRIMQEEEQLNQRLAQLTSDAETARQLEQIRPPLQSLLQRAGDICQQPDDIKERFHSQVLEIVTAVGAVVGDRPGPWVSPPPSWQELCASADFPTVLLREVEGHLSSMGNPSAERETVERQLVDLNERREQVLRDMTNDLAGASIAENIKWLMLIIFGVGAATLAGVKLFSEKVQQELIASGQIVQFVTILILLGVILALGLAQRLAAETLGTLLGGLAGYVLSQGVGRQAQQKVLNEIRSAAAPPSPPAPPQG